jgi:hypothetical protein
MVGEAFDPHLSGGPCMKRELQLVCAAAVFYAPSQALAVVDGCPSGECSGGRISPWFYVFFAVLTIVLIIYKLIFGNDQEKAESKTAMLVGFRFAFLFLIIPTFAFFVFGGRDGNGGDAALFSFFGMVIAFIFRTRIAKWAVGED